MYKRHLLFAAACLVAIPLTAPEATAGERFGGRIIIQFGDGFRGGYFHGFGPHRFHDPRFNKHRFHEKRHFGHQGYRHKSFAPPQRYGMRHHQPFRHHEFHNGFGHGRPFHDGSWTRYQPHFRDH